MINGYSLCLNEWALDKDIKNELGLLLIISSLTAEKGYCYASNEYFANLFNLPTNTISIKIKKLEKKGYISIKYEKRGCEVLSREIRLSKFQIDDIKNFKSTILKKSKENNLNVDNKEKDIEYKYSISKESENFDEFWQLYPLKREKAKCQKKYLKITEKQEVIMQGLQNYIDYIKREHKENYIKYPYTWLNGECWNDQYDITMEDDPYAGYIDLDKQ